MWNDNKDDKDGENGYKESYDDYKETRNDYRNLQQNHKQMDNDNKVMQTQLETHNTSAETKWQRDTKHRQRWKTTTKRHNTTTETHKTSTGICTSTHRMTSEDWNRLRRDRRQQTTELHQQDHLCLCQSGCVAAVSERRYMSDDVMMITCITPNTGGCVTLHRLQCCGVWGPHINTVSGLIIITNIKVKKIKQNQHLGQSDRWKMTR